MKKYIFFFALSFCLSVSPAFSQNQASTGQGQGQIIISPNSTSSSDNTPQGTITKAGKNQQSVYTPPSSATGKFESQSTTSDSQQASPTKGQPATVDPKKQD